LLFLKLWFATTYICNFFIYKKGLFTNLPDSLLSITLLSWGNGFEDLVCDVTVASAGRPEAGVVGIYYY
jgi:Ca2+/Na+ antiporter